jgi:hypothetical protein
MSKEHKNTWLMNPTNAAMWKGSVARSCDFSKEARNTDISVNSPTDFNVAANFTFF